MTFHRQLLQVLTTMMAVARCRSLSVSSTTNKKGPPLFATTLTTSEVKTPVTVSENQKALDSAPKFPRTWVPVASTNELNPDRPTPISFLDQNYVVYQGQNDEWVVADDACPHRLAPLSEGRIDKSGERLLECAYHGWSFDNAGQCQDIPQLSETMKEQALKNPKCHVKSYTTMDHKGIVWAWLWKEDPVELTVKDPTITPEYMMDGLNTVTSSYTRDLPYGWDTLTENLIDPAHVPFAHHNLQGTRDDAIAINMTVPENMSQSGFDLKFEDRTMKMMRKGAASFRAPFTLVYHGDYVGSDAKFDLTTINIPTRPGWSRSIVIAGAGGNDKSTSTDKDGNPIKGKQSMVSKIFKMIPVWVVHQLSNRFLDSDLAFLHYQEQEREKRGGDSNNVYYTPAPADRAINAFRSWKSKYAHVPLPLPPPIKSRSVLFDHYSQHTSHCRHCQEGLKSVRQAALRTKAVLALGALMAATKFHVLGGSIIVLCIGALQILSFLEKGFMVGNYNHYEND